MKVSVAPRVMVTEEVLKVVAPMVIVVLLVLPQAARGVRSSANRASKVSLFMRETPLVHAHVPTVVL
jgi:hypothetical protein